MRKGEGAGWIIAIIIILGVIGYFLFSNTSKIKADGGKRPIEYKNDVITLEDYRVTDKSPYENGITTIEFDVKNNGDKTIPYVEVYFFDSGGFKFEELKCEAVNSEKLGNEKCIFKNLEPLDTRSVLLTLRAPSAKKLIVERTVSFSVKYDISGSRDALIPIIDGTTKKKPSSKFSQSTPSYGPISLNIEPKLEREIVVGDKTVKEYWGVYGRTFETEFKFTHVGSEQKIVAVNISKGNVSFKLSGLDVSENCDFNKVQDYWYSKKWIVVPYDTLFCNFNPTENLPEYTAVISVEFNYTYEFLRDETFIVQPRD